MHPTLAHGLKGWFLQHRPLCAMLTILLSATASGLELPAEDADAWRLKKEAGSIRVYTMDQQDSGFRAFKAEALIKAPVENLMAVMANPGSCVEWVYNCVESRALGSGSFLDRYAYSVNDMPWPVSDRDYVLHIRTRGDRASGEIIMDLNATPGMLPGIDNRIRVDLSYTRYHFIPQGSNTRLIWVQHTDPNGALPVWLVNSLLVDIPLRSLQSLERLARTPPYQNHELVYDIRGHLQDVRPGTTQEMTHAR